MALYKYASFNDEFTQINLKNHILYFNTPNKFNDPFDICSSFEMGNLKIFDKNFVLLMNNTTVNITDITDEDILDRMTIKTRSDYQSSQYGITCFSKDNDNIVMWSNYADKHRGICLEFNDNLLVSKLSTKKVLSRVEGAITPIKATIIPIQYGENREKFSMEQLAKKEFPKNTIKFLSSKYKAWSYEKEVRIMASGPRFSFPNEVYYESECITRIILGAMMPVSDYLKFYKLKKESLGDISVSLSMLHKQNYKLEIKPINADEQKILYQNMKYLIDNIIIFKKYKFIKDYISRYGENQIKKYLQKAIETMDLYTVRKCFDDFCQDTVLIDAIEDASTSSTHIGERADIFIDTLAYQVHYLCETQWRKKDTDS